LGKKKNTSMNMLQAIICAGMAYFPLVANSIGGIEIVSEVI
jgi:hypothetical protein